MLGREARVRAFLTQWETSSAALSIPTLDALVKRAKAEPGKLNWAATAGLPQYAFAGFAKSAGLDMVQVSYRDFSPALQDVSEGRISLVSTGLVPLLPLARAGKVNILALTNRDRSPAAPDIPTATELGFPDLAAAGFQGFFGWHDMPDALRDRIAADVRSIAVIRCWPNASRPSARRCASAPPPTSSP